MQRILKRKKVSLGSCIASGCVGNGHQHVYKNSIYKSNWLDWIWKRFVKSKQYYGNSFYFFFHQHRYSHSFNKCKFFLLFIWISVTYQESIFWFRWKLVSFRRTISRTNDVHISNDALYWIFDSIYLKKSVQMDGQRIFLRLIIRTSNQKKDLILIHYSLRRPWIHDAL